MIRLEKLNLKQGDFSLVDVDLSIPDKGYGILMGPTGCGKTSLIEAICGLRRTHSGKVVLGDTDVTRLAPSKRQIGYVPQDSALFPTMRVDRQIEFGLAIRNVKQTARKDRVNELAELLEIGPLLLRYPFGLSGGERQRVALARALAFRPKLLCLDEPMSALDDELRVRMAQLLRTVQQQEGVTVLHITHNVAEAQQLGTILFRLDKGHVTQLKT